MSTVQIALANLPFPATPRESVALAERAVAEASAVGAEIVCFPECFGPGYRSPSRRVPPPDPAFLEGAWATIAAAAANARVAVVLGTERDVAVELRVARAVDLAYPTCSKRADDRVVADAALAARWRPSLTMRRARVCGRFRCD